MNDQQPGNNLGSSDRSRHEGMMPVGNISQQQGGGGGSPPSPYGYNDSSGGNSGTGLNAATIFRIVLNRWLTVSLLVIFGGVGGIFYAQQATPVYRVQAELEMNVRRPKVINNDAVYEDPNAVRDIDVIFNTRFAKFKSPAMESLAAQEFMEQYPKSSITKRGMPINRYTLASMIRKVRWYKDPSANIVYVSYEASDPEFAAQLVNVLSYCAGVLMMKENQAQSDEAVKWLVTQVSEQREKLEENEKELAVIREEVQLDSLQQRKIALGQAFVTVSDEKESLVSQLASRKTVFEFVKNLKDSDPNLEMLPPGLPKERELDELIRGWRAANDGLLLAADRYTELHPEYKKAADLELRSRQRLEQFIVMSANAVQNEVDLLVKQIEQVDARITTMKEESVTMERSIASGLRTLQRLERKRDAADTSYQAMLRRMEEARLSADENMAFTKVIRNAAVPLYPISPRKVRVLILGLFIGFVGGSLLAIIMAFWTDKVGAVADLKALNLNVIASIPTQKRIDSRGELATIGLRDKFSPMVEVFAGINAILSSDKYFNQTKVILVSSVGPGEGKTISACNLAICSALNGVRTLLIDGDLRRPQLANIFQVSEDSPSLLSWLANTEDHNCKDLVSKGAVDNLDTITSVANAQINPAELLGRGRLAELITWARDNYDRVIIDTPPLGPVGDAQVYANLADTVILVSRIGVTRRRSIKFAVARFHDIDANIFGWIANDVPQSLAGMFGGGEGYGFSYGYGGDYKT